MREPESGDLKLNTVKYDSLAVKVYGAVAILRGIADNTGTYRGFPFAGKIRYMRVFVKRDGRWVAVAMQHTPMPSCGATRLYSFVTAQRISPRRIASRARR
jgi:hypothetical protein